MSVQKVFLIGGARPNFMKLAPLYHAFTRSERFAVTLVHTGQHYDDRMAGGFFRELGLPEPHISLKVGSGSHAAQTAKILERFEVELIQHEPDLVVVVGDVNSTIACAMAAAKIEYADGRRPKVAHVEAGLRSGDRTMPEEINRVLTDAISDYLFATEQSGIDNLRREGKPDESLFLVGNVMIDTLLAQASKARERAAWTRFNVSERGYAVATLHRPANVDNDAWLTGLMGELRAASSKLPIIFPVHPRTRARLERLGLDGSDARLTLCEPLPYVDFLSLLMSARLVLTDSGGIQEETTILRVPCLTLRDNTERPITVTVGTNRLIGTDVRLISGAVDGVLRHDQVQGNVPPLWDGHAAERVVETLERLCANSMTPAPEAVLV